MKSGAYSMSRTCSPDEPSNQYPQMSAASSRIEKKAPQRLFLRWAEFEGGGEDSDEGAVSEGAAPVGGAALPFSLF